MAQGVVDAGTKSRIVVVACKVNIPGDWTDERLEYHVRKGSLELGEIYSDSKDDVPRFCDVDNVMIMDSGKEFGVSLYKRGDKVVIIGVNDAVWTVISCNETHVHIRNIHDVMQWIAVSKVKKIA